MTTIVMIDKIVSVDLYATTLKAVINTIGGGFISMKFKNVDHMEDFTVELTEGYTKTITIIDDQYAH